jgi:myo-inositol-1-phosphate synthase
MSAIRVGIVGVGNCASGIIQGVDLYRKNDKTARALGNPKIGGYRIEDIEFVSAFDVGANKVGKPLSKAIYLSPNMVRWTRSIARGDAIVRESPVLDGVGLYVGDKINPIRSKRSIEQLREEALDEIKRTRTELLVNYLPVGSQKATEFWAEVALEARVGLVNCIPVFIASDEKWARRFSSKGIPIIGDDVKGVVGATIVHRTLARLCSDRSVRVDRTYQINVGGNTDFLNMKEQQRLESKRISKTEAVQSMLRTRLPKERIYVGPSDFIPYLGNTKLAFIRLEGTMFPGAPFNMEMRLEVDDKANSAGVVVDAIRYCKIAKDNGLGGPLKEASAWLMKHPPVSMGDEVAMGRVQEWVSKLRR